ncbi:Phospholipid/cholesterol/gamma-HCH transport system substrate-binding protein [Flavobacterium sp. 9AF]|uniref:MlaD family protein n=1 Tax=Flavobacterium sp. 9AF TaxID=2653142 RepID=UPI0012F4183B|nr:MlaD family protein [Flavobacterium sp. 9AF]VXB30873.1 Phospholipid/cholesterol/gamma-HCH transport system substrate-binding protein [Flavobacterium sp. 9AF]
MKKTANEKLRLGMFVIIGLLLFTAGVYFIGQRQNMFGKSIEISAQFNNINGLQKGNNVRYSGINVGIVKDITMINDSIIKVDLLIEEKMIQHIKKDAIATISTDGLVGNMIVNIIPGKGEQILVKQGDFIKSYTKIGADDMLNTLSLTNENAALLTVDLLKITNAINKEKGPLGMLINDSTASNDIKQIVANLKQTSYEASKTIRLLNGIITSINFDKSVAGLLLNDTLQAKKMKTIIANLEITSLNINKTIDSLNKTIVNVKNGKGAINYLSNDKEFVENLDQTIKNLNEGTDKFNQNMEALKSNFLFRGYFKKLEKEKKNEKQ